MRRRCLLAAAMLGGCAGMFGPSPQRRACLAECNTSNDACILEAAGAEQIQACDRANQECIEQCPS